jgi:trehalose-6-phosphate synthase
MQHSCACVRKLVCIKTTHGKIVKLHDNFNVTESYVNVNREFHEALCPLSRPQNPGIMLDDGAGIHA